MSPPVNAKDDLVVMPNKDNDLLALRSRAQTIDPHVALLGKVCRQSSRGHLFRLNTTELISFHKVFRENGMKLLNHILVDKWIEFFYRLIT